MADPLAERIIKLRAALQALQAQRAVLGETIDPAIAATREKIQALEAQLAPAPPPDERRHITILFSDVVGSVSLAEQLDPEDWRAVIGAVQHAIGSSVTAHGGMIAQYQGDGLIAFFGAHGLREIDVEQAVNAALQAHIAVSQLTLPVPVQLRVGVHTGLVLLGMWGVESKREFGAFGDAVHIAARLQSNAPPGAVLISRDTYQYVRGAFDFAPPRALVLKGKSQPLQTYIVRRARPHAFRVSARGVLGIQTSTIGRETEIQQLRAAYLESYEQRRVLWLQLLGEPGVGKSRLVQELADWLELRAGNLVTLSGRAYDGEQNQPFALVRRLWFDRFQIADDTPLALAREHWVAGFRELTGIADAEPAHALGLLVGLPFQDSPHLGALRHDPMQLRGRAFVVSRAAVRAIRAARPLYIALEDLHWADASTLEYLQQVILQDGSQTFSDADLQGLFILATARNEWQGLNSDCITTLPLAPLTVTASRRLAQELLKNVAEVPPHVIQLIVERAEGMPYFAEELVNYFLDRSIIDRTTDPWRLNQARLDELHGNSRPPLPSTLQYLLRARLDTLASTERVALQRGAIYGRHFWSGGVEALEVDHCDPILNGLEPRGFVTSELESALQGEREWSFHHALLRDVTYDSVLKRDRPALHQKAAAWLELKARESERLDEFAGLLGEHCERGGALLNAAGWYLRAGEHALRQGAMPEARKFFDDVLGLAPPAERELRWRALEGREVTFGRVGEPDKRHADILALLELADTFDDDARRAGAFYREARYFVSVGKPPAAVDAAERALAAARRAGARTVEATALVSLLVTLTRLGEVARARALLAQARERASTCGDDFVYAQTLMQIGVHYTDAGELAQAVEPYTTAADLARRISNRALEGQILSNLGYCYARLGLYALARPALEKTLELAAAVSERRDYAYGLQNLGWTYLCSGNQAAARQFQEQALREFTALGDGFGRAASVLYLGHIAERVGDVPAAMQHFTDALEHFTAMGVRGYRMDCAAGLARCALSLGDLPRAQHYASQLWTYLAENGAAGIELPSLVYQTCADIFQATGAHETARAAVEAGYQELLSRADKITDAEWRKSFLENVSEHRAMVGLWARTHTTS